MSKRSACGSVLRCKQCRITYDTMDQLVRHKDDRHGPQVVCTVTGCNFVIPKKRTDVQRRHLVTKHQYEQGVPLEVVRKVFQPYFEEAETPVPNVSVRSTIYRPTPLEDLQQADFRVPPTEHSVATADITGNPDQPVTLPEQQTTDRTRPTDQFDTLEDQTTIPEDIEEFLSGMDPPETPAPLKTTPTEQHDTLPNLELDWTFPNPRLSRPVRYEDVTTTPTDQKYQENQPTTPDVPSAAGVSLVCNSIVKDIPLDPRHDGQTSDFHTFPRPRPDETTVIDGKDVRQRPEFPPKKVRVHARSALDPKLLFRDAPSDFLTGVMARLAAQHRLDGLRRAGPDNVDVSFEAQDLTVTRLEKVTLPDGRTLTLRMTCTLSDELRVSRTAQTQTTEQSGTEVQTEDIDLDSTVPTLQDLEGLLDNF